MKKKNLLTKNNIQKKYLNNTFVKKYNNEYKKIISEINLEINDPKKTLNVLDNNYKFNFKIKDIQRFKSFGSIKLR